MQLLRYQATKRLLHSRHMQRLQLSRQGLFNQTIPCPTSTQPTPDQHCRVRQSLLPRHIAARKQCRLLLKPCIQLCRTRPIPKIYLHIHVSQELFAIQHFRLCCLSHSHSIQEPVRHQLQQSLAANIATTRTLHFLGQFSAIIRLHRRALPPQPQPRVSVHVPTRSLQSMTLRSSSFTQAFQ